MLALENLNVAPTDKIVEAFAAHYKIDSVDLRSKKIEKIQQCEENLRQREDIVVEATAVVLVVVAKRM